MLEGGCVEIWHSYIPSSDGFTNLMCSSQLWNKNEIHFIMFIKQKRVREMNRTFHSLTLEVLYFCVQLLQEHLFLSFTVQSVQPLPKTIKVNQKYMQNCTRSFLIFLYWLTADIVTAKHPPTATCNKWCIHHTHWISKYSCAEFLCKYSCFLPIFNEVHVSPVGDRTGWTKRRN